jgi:hypothetical protein
MTSGGYAESSQNSHKQRNSAFNTPDPSSDKVRVPVLMLAVLVGLESHGGGADQGIV